jgi:hypothetical protein
MRILSDTLTMAELRVMAQEMFGDMVKAVVDVRRGMVAIQAELHSDLEALLLEHGSQQEDLWGINLYPNEKEDSLIEFDSLINIRPSVGNRTRTVESESVRQRITRIVQERTTP